VIRPILATAAAALGASLLACPTAVAQAECGPDQATAMKPALDVNWIDSATDKYWNSAPIASNYDPCADLSAVLVTTEGSGPNGPVLVFLFHRGQYFGTATQKAYKATTLNVARSGGDTVVLDYPTKGDSAVGLVPGVSSVRFQWQGGHVVTLDPPPAV
jgi:hypothetical protein